MRGYRQRCADRLDRLRRRAEFLALRIADRPGIACVHDKQERSAVLWAIEEIERWDVVADVLNGEGSDAEKLAAISTLLRSRLRPSAGDLQRTPGLAKQFPSAG